MPTQYGVEQQQWSFNARIKTLLTAWILGLSGGSRMAERFQLNHQIHRKSTW